MKDLLQEILDWSEAWAPLIPLIVLVVWKPGQKWVKPLKYYMIIAIIVSLISTVIWKRIDLGIEGWMEENMGIFRNKEGKLSNTIFYNAHSVFRFLLFAWFFHYQGNIFRKLNTVIAPVFLILLIVTFIFYRDIREFSSLLLATEAALLLFYSLVYYLILLRDEKSQIKREPPFWVVTGLSIYVVINFPIFLFYTVLSKEADKFAVDIWDLHNITYIVFCLFIAKSFYAASAKH